MSPELVVKDPRLSWFIGLWRVAAIRTGATPVFATMLRPPAEVVGSKQTYYANQLGSAHLVASWLNMMLHTERATRESVADGGRVFVRYGDLLDDWVKTTMHVAETLQLQHVLHCDSEQIRDGHRFVDPGLRRMQQTLDDLELPDPPARPHRRHLGGAQQARRPRWRHHRGARRARRAPRGLRRPLRGVGRDLPLVGRGRRAAHQAPGSSRARRRAEERRGADRIPHGVRAAVPPSVRRGLRRAAGRERPRTSERQRTGISATSRAHTEYDIVWPWTRPGGLRAGTTAVLRVKDEAPSLPFVLPPLLRACDHVLVVDNGSTDGTPEVTAEPPPRRPGSPTS